MRVLPFLMIACQPNETIVVTQEESVVEPIVDPNAIEEVEEEVQLNQPPKIVSLEFEQSEYKQGEEIRITYETFDPEGDAVREEIYWSVNGRELISEKGKVLRKNLKKGDEVGATLVARDSSSNEATEAQSSINTTILNSPPQWVRDPREIKEIEGYTVQAVDPDGDPINYRLTGAPAGMSISQRGRLSYKGSKSEKGGKYTVSIIAEDSDKLNVQWSFAIELSAGSDAPK